MSVTVVTGNKDKASYLEPSARVVKPRSREYPRRSVIAIQQDTAIDENGQVWTTRELAETLQDREPTLFACVGAADFLAYLNTIFLLRTPESWQWRTASYERDICRPDGVRVAARVSVIVHFFGWKNGNYHKIIDPVTMYGRKLDEVWPGDTTPLDKLLRWASTIRDFCDDNGIEVRPTTGAISAQFLTDRRFYPNARRKVPAKTNAQIREQLPGNYYVLNVHPHPGREYTANYLDQHRAHHYHARTAALPCANNLYAYGRFTDLANVCFDTTWSRFYGLYCLDLRRDTTHRARTYQWLRGILPTEHELTKQFVYSNELPHLLDMGYRVTGVRAAWGSRHLDTGLGKYATWSEEQLDHYDDAPWLKPLLLSAYGTLATKPKYAQAIFRLAKAGEPVRLRTGHRQLNGKHTKGTQKLEPNIANVLHRGMIEAATRSESVGLAQWLNSEGHQILSIYADGVIVRIDDDKPLPVIPDPWRLKSTLNHLQFINQQAFISGEMTKLPGVSSELRKYSRSRTGVAPKKVKYEAITGRPIVTDKRI